MLEDIMYARLSDLRVSAREIEHRMECERLFQGDRHERPSRTVRPRLLVARWLPWVAARPHDQVVGKRLGGGPAVQRRGN